MQSTTLILLLSTPGQFLPPPTAEEGKAAAQQSGLALRVYNRDQALKRVPEALGFTQEYGEAGVSAILNCSPQTGRDLVAMHETGSLKATPRPEVLVGIIARHGEKVGAWVVEHKTDLADPGAWAAFEKEPLEYVHGLKALRKGEPAWKTIPREGVAVALALFVIGLVLWKRSRK